MPNPIWLIVLGLLAYILTAMILAIMREERPAEYEELSRPSDAFSGAAGPFHLAFTIIVPMKYESWGLTQSQKWVCRLALVVYVSLIILILWALASLL